MQKKELYKKFIDYFSKHLPEAETELEYVNPYELLVAVILSAQCTDKRVNMITPALFKKYPTAEKLAKATQADIFKLIKSCSYPNSKAIYLSGMAKMLVSDFNGIVPSDIDELQKLPGVGRKSANVVLAVAFKKPAMPVDTHVFRVSARIGLTTDAANPLETEKQLVKNIPQDKLTLAHHWLILHGRYVCIARKPKCEECELKKFCRYYLSLKK
ncbi:MAG: endonuclease III [Bacteroidales bacterium]|nr:endonuclease III [Bacteroidales bacterium]